MDYMNANKMRTKNDIINRISDYIDLIESGENVCLNISEALYYRYIINLKKFKQLIQQTELPESFGDDWYYKCVFFDTKFALHLNKDGIPTKDKDGNVQTPFHFLEILIFEIKLLTAREYATINNVTEGAVRQWIRRGKLLNAIKFGNEWRIPELSDVNRKLRIFQHHYYWDSDLFEVPAGIYESQLKKYDSLIIKESSEPQKYNLHFYSRKYNPRSVRSTCDVEIPAKEKEKLELWLIANPLVKTPASLIQVLE